MLRICELILGTWKDVILDNEYCVPKGITKIESKGIYAGYIINNKYYCPKVVHEDLIDTYFQYKEFGDSAIFELITQKNKPFRIFL